MSSNHIYHLVYKITNRITGQIYIGVHSTDDPNDGYMGSGLRILRALKKYGLENFEKIILKSHTSKDAAYEHEKKIVTESFVKSDRTYNIRIGGSGGFDHINKSDRYKHKQKAAQKMAWQKHSRRQEMLVERQTFAYKQKQRNSDLAIKTPFGIFPSKADCMRELKIGDITSLNRWLDGKVVTLQQINAQKTKLFTPADIGKSTTDIGWGYVPIVLPNTAQ